MKTKNIVAIVALSIFTFTSCIKEEMDCPKNDIQLISEISANTILNISIAEGEANTFIETLNPEIENMTVLIFNNNKKLVKCITVSKEKIIEGYKNKKYTLNIQTTTGYHFFYVLANTPESQKFDIGDHFNDIVGNTIYQAEDIFITSESPRVLLKEGDNTVQIDLIQY